MEFSKCHQIFLIHGTLFTPVKVFMFSSLSDIFFLEFKMSWTHKKSSAEALYHKNDFEKAMEGYAAAAAAAIDQNAAPRDIAKCYTNASQMGWRGFVKGIYALELLQAGDEKYLDTVRSLCFASQIH
jgi:hypothetical protein